MDMRETERILFRYFARLKALKYFVKPTAYITRTITDTNVSIKMY